MVAMMALRRTPLLPPGWGLGRPSCSGIGASSVVRAAVSSAGMLLAGGRRSAALQIAFCSTGAFFAVLCRSAASPVEEDRRLLPPPIDPACLVVACGCELRNFVPNFVVFR